MAEPCMTAGLHGSVWAINCETCGKTVRMGPGARAGIKRLPLQRHTKGQPMQFEEAPLSESGLDDPAVGRCNRCQRSTWDRTTLGTEDRMTQPDGNPCGGRFVPITSATYPKDTKQ